MSTNTNVPSVPKDLTEMSDDDLRWHVEQIRRGNSAKAASLNKRLLAEADRRNLVDDTYEYIGAMHTLELRAEIEFEESEQVDALLSPETCVYRPERLMRLRAELRSRVGTRKIKVTAQEREWLVNTGPFPFTVNFSEVDWPEHTEEEVIEKHTKLGTAISMRVVRKLMGEIQ